jgi:hypothetical protein
LKQKDENVLEEANEHCWKKLRICGRAIQSILR